MKGGGLGWARVSERKWRWRWLRAEAVVFVFSTRLASVGTVGIVGGGIVVLRSRSRFGADGERRGEWMESGWRLDGEWTERCGGYKSGSKEEKRERLRIGWNVGYIHLQMVFRLFALYDYLAVRPIVGVHLYKSWMGNGGQLRSTGTINNRYQFPEPNTNFQ